MGGRGALPADISHSLALSLSFSLSAACRHQEVDAVPLAKLALPDVPSESVEVGPASTLPAV